MKRQIATCRTVKQWKVLVDQQVDSGQPAPNFCTAEGAAYIRLLHLAPPVAWG
ncbi:MAG: hypothetical protein ACJAW7_002034 [Candidatus Azotimanducaceae bacterium]|jgi:hypothetical protein